MPNSQYGQLIRRRREQLGIRQVELARRARIGQGTLSQIESGYKAASPRLLTALEAALELPPGSLAGERLGDAGEIPTASLDRFLAGPVAAALQITDSEIARLRTTRWLGPHENASDLAWADLVRALRGIQHQD